MNVTEDFIYVYGYRDRANWWAYYNGTVDCISRLTGCSPTDLLCRESFALQQLVVGPVIAHHTPDAAADNYTSSADTLSLHHRLSGATHEVKESLVKDTAKSAPFLFDAGIHLRTQFETFEHPHLYNTSEVDIEVDTFMKSKRKEVMFTHMTDQLLNLLNQSFQTSDPIIGNSNNPSTALIASDSHKPTAQVYLSCDNIVVKKALHHHLLKAVEAVEATLTFRLNIVFLKVEKLHHAILMHDWSNKNDVNTTSGLFDTSLDWYNIARSKFILTWRRSEDFSTFSLSAVRLFNPPLYGFLVLQEDNPKWYRLYASVCTQFIDDSLCKLF